MVREDMSKKYYSIFRLDDITEHTECKKHAPIKNLKTVKIILEKANNIGGDIKLKSLQEEIKVIRNFKPIP